MRALRFVHWGEPVAALVLAILGVLFVMSLVLILPNRQWRRVLSLRRVGIAFGVLAVPVVVSIASRDTRFAALAGGVGGVLLVASVVGAGLRVRHASRAMTFCVSLLTLLSCFAVGFFVASLTHSVEATFLLHHL